MRKEYIFLIFIIFYSINGYTFDLELQHTRNGKKFQVGMFSLLSYDFESEEYRTGKLSEATINDIELAYTGNPDNPYEAINTIVVYKNRLSDNRKMNIAQWFCNYLNSVYMHFKNDDGSSNIQLMCPELYRSFIYPHFQEKVFVTYKKTGFFDASMKPVGIYLTPAEYAGFQTGEIEAKRIKDVNGKNYFLTIKNFNLFTWRYEMSKLLDRKLLTESFINYLNSKYYFERDKEFKHFPVHDTEGYVYDINDSIEYYIYNVLKYEYNSILSAVRNNQQKTIEILNNPDKRILSGWYIADEPINKYDMKVVQKLCLTIRDIEMKFAKQSGLLDHGLILGKYYLDRHIGYWVERFMDEKEDYYYVNGERKIIKRKRYSLIKDYEVVRLHYYRDGNDNRKWKNIINDVRAETQNKIMPVIGTEGYIDLENKNFGTMHRELNDVDYDKKIKYLINLNVDGIWIYTWRRNIVKKEKNKDKIIYKGVVDFGKNRWLHPDYKLAEALEDIGCID